MGGFAPYLFGWFQSPPSKCPMFHQITKPPSAKPPSGSRRFTFLHCGSGVPGAPGAASVGSSSSSTWRQVPSSVAAGPHALFSIRRIAVILLGRFATRRAAKFGRKHPGQLPARLSSDTQPHLGSGWGVFWCGFHKHLDKQVRTATINYRNRSL